MCPSCDHFSLQRYYSVKPSWIPKNKKEGQNINNLHFDDTTISEIKKTCSDCFTFPM